MKVNAIQCSECGNIIYSRATHDLRFCSCKSVFIDGGFDYTRIGAKKKINTFKYEVKATKKELYNDWNKRIDKYGLVEATIILKPVREHEQEWMKSMSITKRINYQLWKIFYGMTLNFSIFLRRLADRIDRW